MSPHAPSSLTEPAETPRRPRPSAYLGLPIAEFLLAADDALLGTLTSASQFDIVLDQRGAWQESIQILKESLFGIDGYLYLEFDVPRLGSRIDAVVISGPVIFPIEFKAGESAYPRDAINQAWDYALDLKNFHRASHGAAIMPILVATAAPDRKVKWQQAHADGVRPPLCCGAEGLRAAIATGLALEEGSDIDGDNWGRAPYHPTPTMIQAAQALYAQHSVHAISRSDAGARNLAITSKRVEEVIENARVQQKKVIIFVTGVPGAGKTLVGLNVATQKRDSTSPTHAVFLSGNTPLVSVLREALVRNEFARRKALGTAGKKRSAEHKVKQFIQNVHHFRDDGIRDSESPPDEHVVIFDEAQRSWNQKKTSSFMQFRKGQKGFTQSEPQFLIGYMNRHTDWAVIVCLVGGGQEINEGESGIGAWIDAIRQHYSDWVVYISPRLVESEYTAAASIHALAERSSVQNDPRLHLSVSMRSFRAERVSDFVKAILDCDVQGARDMLSDISEGFPIVITRDLATAKAWVREHTRGTERCGLVASSKAQRLKPYAIDVRLKVDPVQWFLGAATDTRSSNYLEDTATEFQTQGLELDWACVNWDADLRHSKTGWAHHRFRGSDWVQVRKAELQRYLLNAYRVLLTRARQGMVLFVPQGDRNDPTRDPAYYEGTYRYLREVGLQELR